MATMAPKQNAQRSMQNYVHQHDRRNDNSNQAGIPHTQSYEDIKVRVPKTGQNANIKHQRRRASDVLQQRAQNPSPDAQHEIDDPPPFYATDTASIGDTSVTPSIQPAPATEKPRARIAPESNEPQAMQAQSSSPGATSEAEEDEDDVDQEDEESSDGEALPEHTRVGRTKPTKPTRAAGELSEAQMRKMYEMPETKAKIDAALALPYVNGDSYPSTTSGRPSIADDDPPRPVRAVQQQAPVSGQLPSRSSGQRQQLAPHPTTGEIRTQARVQASQQARQIQPANVQLSRADAPDHTVAHQQPPEGFAYARLPTKPNIKPLSNNDRSNEHTANARRPIASNNTAQRGSAPTIERNRPQSASERPLTTVKHPQSVRAQAKAEPPTAKTHHSVEKPGQAAVQAIVKPSPPVSDTDYGQISEPEYQDEEVHPVEGRAASELDYDGTELYKMEYGSLKRQSFDEDPRAEGIGLPDVDSGASIDQKMTAVSALGGEGQQLKYLMSMPLNEWEEAGDWFLGKFGETLTRLKSLRRDKRKAAREFEEEIEGHHLAVVKKRKVTDDALGQMRQSGGQVLKGTPKKLGKTQ